MNTILFDMDGTIFDSELISFLAWSQAAKKLDLPIDMNTLIGDMYGLNNNTLADFFLNRFGEDFPRLELINEWALGVQSYIHANGLPKKPGVPEIFSTLKSRGYKLGLVSSTIKQTITRVINKTGIQDKKEFSNII